VEELFCLVFMPGAGIKQCKNTHNGRTGTTVEALN